MASPSKKESIREMFDDISPDYDFLNHFLSFGIDFLWRKRLVGLLKKKRPGLVLDVATGTGDLAIAIAMAMPVQVTGVDISEKMLAIGRAKVDGKGLSNVVHLQVADAESLPFPDDYFDVITVAFGVRNYENPDKGLREMRRVLRPGGVMMILEFSHPGSFPMKQLYGIYSRCVIPVMGRMISGSSKAYTYLPESVAAFPSGDEFLAILSGVGLKNESCLILSAGIASIYCAEK